MPIENSDKFILERANGEQYSVTGTELRKYAARFIISDSEFFPDAHPGTFLDKVSFNYDNVILNINSTNQGGGEDIKAQIDVKQKPYLVNNSGRFYCYANKRWVTDSDDNYGNNYYQFAESGGTGASPIMEWEHLGMFVPKGTKLDKLNFIARANNSEITDFDLWVVVRYPDDEDRWHLGIDNDSEMQNNIVSSTLFVEPGMAGNMLDIRKKVIDLNGFEVPEDCMLSLYLKPIGTNTSTRYVRATWTWEMVAPTAHPGVQ